MKKSENGGPGPGSDMLLSPEQLKEFKAEGTLPIPGLVPPDVLEGWRDQVRAACTGGVDLDDPGTWPSGRYAPEGGWPEFTPGLYDLPNLQSIVEQIGGGAFAPSHPAGEPWSPQIPMTRVILPSPPGTEWEPPGDGHLDGYATGWGGGFMAFFAVLLWDVDSPRGGGTAWWPRSHLANHRYFLQHPEQFDGSYIFSEPVRSGGTPGHPGGGPGCWRVGVHDGEGRRRPAVARPHHPHRLAERGRGRGNRGWLSSPATPTGRCASRRRWSCSPTRTARRGRPRRRKRPRTPATRRPVFCRSITPAGGSSATTCRKTSGSTGALLSIPDLGLRVLPQSHTFRSWPFCRERPRERNSKSRASVRWYSGRSGTTAGSSWIESKPPAGKGAPPSPSRFFGSLSRFNRAE